MPAQLKRMPIGLLGAASSQDRSPSSEASAARDRRRLEGWFRDHFDALWRLALRLGVPHAQADDVVQEAFITAERRARDITAGSERRMLRIAATKLSRFARS